MKLSRLLAIVLGLALLPALGMAKTYSLPGNGGSVVGKVQYYSLRGGQTFSDVAEIFDLGYYELLEANPHVNPMRPVAGTKLVIPTRFVLPNAPHKGIVINLAELRLYYYPPGRNQVMTFPIGIGRQGWDTPTGVMKITQKRKNPTWRVPASVWADAKANGITLPKVMPPGPDNPLGDYAMRLTRPSYLIHGTNKANGVGRRVSAGCIRMYPQDVKKVFGLVSVGTSVNIVNQPFKSGWLGNNLYLEAHRPLFEEREKGAHVLQNKLLNIVDGAAGSYEAKVNWAKAKRVAAQQQGIPRVIASQ